MNGFIDVKRQNREEFDKSVEERLKCYVYVLRDPIYGRVFYIGKGGGKGQGNSRVLAHFDEAEEWLKADKKCVLTEKIRTILTIWREERPVDFFIVRHGLEEEFALHVEAALIDAIPLGSNSRIDNIKGGEDAYAHGLLSADDVDALKATPVNPKDKYSRIFVFQIHRALAEGRNPCEAIKGDWAVRKELREHNEQIPTFAVGVAGGLGRIFFKIREWTEATRNSDKYEFVGEEIENNEFLKRSFVNILSPAIGYLQRGGGYVVIDFDGNGHFKFVRGLRDKTAQYNC